MKAYKNACSICFLRDSELCLCEERDYGCHRFVKELPVTNPKGKRIRCGDCRYLFLKSKAEKGDKSFVCCGRKGSIVEKIKPSPNCPYFKPLRAKQIEKKKQRFNRYKKY